MMATERSFPLYLLATVVISSVKLSSQTMPYNRSTANITDNVSVVRSQCLSRCGLETEHDKTRFSGARQNVKNSNCYRKCIESSAQKRLQSTKRKHRSSMVMTSGYTKYGCPLNPEIVERKLGDVENLAVAFLQRRGQDGNLIWIANVTWDATFSNEGTVNQCKGFLITWSMPRNAPDSFEIYCRFHSKNFTSTSFIIESNSTGWVYPGAIGVRVLVYPSTKEYASGFDLVLFDPKESAASSMPRIMSSVKKKETVTYPIHPYNVSSQDTGSPTAKHPPTPGKPAWQSGLAIFLGCFVGVTIAMLVVYVTWKRRRNRPTHVQDEENFEYDLSIFYSTQDEKWVTEELMPLLETQNNFKCFVHFRDFEVGRVLNENIADAVYKCRKNLAVVSRNFLKSNYCKEELHMSLERVQRLGNNSLIVVNLDGVSEDKLPKAVLRRTFVNLTNSLEQRTWKNRLVRQISVEDKKAPSLNGNPARSFVRLQKDNTVTVVQKPNTSRNENEV